MQRGGLEATVTAQWSAAVHVHQIRRCVFASGRQIPISCHRLRLQDIRILVSGNRIAVECGWCCSAFGKLPRLHRRSIGWSCGYKWRCERWQNVPQLYEVLWKQEYHLDLVFRMHTWLLVAFLPVQLVLALSGIYKYLPSSVTRSKIYRKLSQQYI